MKAKAILLQVVNRNFSKVCKTQLKEVFVFGQNSDDVFTMWIKSDWTPFSKSEFYAPIVEVFTKRQPSSTHKIAGKNLYFKLYTSERGYAFEHFIERCVKIERL